MNLSESAEIEHERINRPSNMGEVWRCKCAWVPLDLTTGRPAYGTDAVLMVEAHLWEMGQQGKSTMTVRPQEDLQAQASLDRINRLLAEHGIEYPTGSRGVEDALNMLSSEIEQRQDMVKDAITAERERIISLMRLWAGRETPTWDWYKHPGTGLNDHPQIARATLAHFASLLAGATEAGDES